MERLVIVCLVLGTLMSNVPLSSAERLEGRVENTPEWGSGYIDLRAPMDFKKGDRLKILIGGSAKKALVRLLEKGGYVDSHSGIVGGPRPVPQDRVLEVVLDNDYRQIVQISVHGNPRPWNLFFLGEDNGPAMLVSVERVARNSTD
jgi:hypothetical protein